MANTSGAWCAVGRRVYPIDAIWLPGGLEASGAAVNPGDGDHTVAQSSFPVAFQKCKVPH